MGNFRAIVLDFETTGLSPNCGDRTIEVGAVVVEDGAIVDRFQSLMNPGMRRLPLLLRPLPDRPGQAQCMPIRWQ